MRKKTNNLAQHEPVKVIDPDLTPPEDFLDLDEGEDGVDDDQDEIPRGYSPKQEEDDDTETPQQLLGENDDDPDDGGDDDPDDDPDGDPDEEDDVQSLNGDPPELQLGEPTRRKRNHSPNKASSPSSRPIGRPRVRPLPDPSKPKNLGGRPRRSPIPGEDDEGMRGTATFPKPFYFHFKDEIKEQKGKPPSFFRYWRQVWKDDELKQRIVVYVYRTWPVLLEGRRQLEKLNEPIRLEELPLRYGAGDYHLKMNDMGNSYKTLAVVTVKGFRDEQEHPPVFELDALDVKDPLNQSFLERLRSRGIRVPGDPGYVDPEEKVKDDDMANAEVMRTFAETMERTTDRAIRLAENQQQQAQAHAQATQPAAAPQPTPEQVEVSKANSTSLAIVAQSMQMGQQIIANAVSAAQGLNQDGTAKVVAPPPDPMAQINAMVTLMTKLKELNPPPPPPVAPTTDPALTAILGRLTQVLEDRHSSVGVDIAAKEVMRPKSPLEQLKEMAEMKETMREMLGIEENSGGGWTEHLPVIIQGLGLLGSVIASGLHNLAIIKSGSGTPVAPPGPGQILTPEQQAAVKQAGFQMPQSQPQPGFQPQPQPGFQPQPQPGDPNNMDLNPFAEYHSFLRTLQPSLLRAFNDGVPGHEYAETLVDLGDNGLFGPDSSGRQIYDTLLETGVEKISALIKTFPPIWGVVSQTPKKWEKFLNDFFHADEIYAQQQMDEEAAGAAKDAGPTVIPATPIKE